MTNEYPGRRVEMKQMLLIVLAAILVIGVTACSTSSGQEQNDKTATGKR